MESIVRKREVDCKKQFLLFPQCFLPCMALILHYKCALKMLSAIYLNLDQFKILLYGNGFKDGIDW